MRYSITASMMAILNDRVQMARQHPRVLLACRYSGQSLFWMTSTKSVRMKPGTK
jgi:hypothetical protein